MQVSQIAQVPPPSVKPTAMVDEAVRVMQNARGGAVVITDQRRPAGMFTERDVLLRVVAASKDPKTTLVREVMTSSFETIPADTDAIPADTDAIRALEIMVSRHIRHLPLVDAKGRLVGLVSMRNILLNYMDALRGSLEQGTRNKEHGTGK